MGAQAILAQAIIQFVAAVEAAQVQRGILN